MIHLVTIDSVACLLSKEISDILRVFEFPEGRDEISEVNSGNEMMVSLCLV